MNRLIFIAGGVMSGVGKGVATASIGKILQSKGFKVSLIKADPYLNIDAGTMNPIEHGEVFVMADGTECDQDIGNYERFLDKNLNKDNYMTTGQIYQNVINRERNLGYHGKCVQPIPHITDEIILRIDKVGKKTKADFILIEIGGTVGEYENLLFLEAGRMMRLKNPKNVLFILVSYLPIPKMIGEIKTKPTQHAVRAFNLAGIQPDFILCRCSVPLDDLRKEKIAIFCNMDKENVISAPDVENIYEIPINFEKENLGDKILKKFCLKSKKQDLDDWQKLIKTIKTIKKIVKIGIVGKYFEAGEFTLMDSYISVIEAVKHGSWINGVKPEIFWLSAEKYEKNCSELEQLKKFDGIIIPGGFGKRGIEGKIKVIEFCRKNKIPFLGLCLGMQLAVIEFARNVCGLKNANSSEFASTKMNVIDVMLEQKDLLKEKKYGGTMRLGEYKCELKENSLSWKIFRGQKYIFERHRHRYEFNNKFKEVLEQQGLIISGINPDRNLVEIIELKNHPFFIGVQFHPEFKSKPLKPHPLFREFIKESISKYNR